MAERVIRYFDGASYNTKLFCSRRKPQDQNNTKDTQITRVSSTNPKNVDKLLLSGSIEKVTDRVLSTSANAGGYLSAGKPKYIPGGGGFFETVGRQGLPSQQPGSIGASSSSEPAESSGPWNLLNIPVGIYTDTPKTPSRRKNSPGNQGRRVARSRLGRSRPEYART